MILALVQRFGSCVLSAALAAAILLPSGLVHGQSVPGQGSWETTLLGRDINGNAIASNSPLAVFLYDTSLDVTWLRNAEASGLLNWSAAKNWASTLNVGGFTGWRLPTHADTGTPGCNWGYSGTDCGYNVLTKTGSTVYSEMGQLWYNELGNLAYYDTSATPNQPGWGLSNTGAFVGLRAAGYWSGVEYSGAYAGFASPFSMSAGEQGIIPQDTSLYALAVRPGDVLSPVPEPQILCMLSLGLWMVGSLARWRRAV